jgi:hypothetical protein
LPAPLNKTLDLMSLPDDTLELYAEYGITAEKAQVVEVAAGNAALGFLALGVDTKRITPEQREMFRSIVDDVNRKTLGALLRSVRSWANLDDSLLQIVDNALERRNYLAHRFFPHHNFAIFDVEGRKVMMAELKDIQTTLDRAHRALSSMSSILLKIGGHEDKSAEIAESFTKRARRIEI